MEVEGWKGWDGEVLCLCSSWGLLLDGKNVGAVVLM